jgi:hypothetical protein
MVRVMYLKDYGHVQTRQKTEKRRRLDTKGIYVIDCMMEARVFDFYVKMLKISIMHLEM